MAPMCPEEVDVYSVPHSRMKELVNKYLEMLTLTNFTNVLHMTTLLENLYKTFYEFVAHERIENKFIMKKLKDKLRALQIQNTAVCNCHNDSQLTYIINLLEDGYKCTKKSDADRINYGLMLRRTLKQFSETFLPHMAQEEEVFMPLLMQYFTFEELKQIKATVLQQHFNVEPDEEGGEEFLKDKTSDKQKTECKTDYSYALETSVNDLSDEIIMNIFSYLTPQDLCRCARVSVGWNRLAMDGSLWTCLYPVNWAKGNWGSQESVYEEDQQADAATKLEKLYDEDADVDESETTDNWDAEAHEVECRSRHLMLLSFPEPKAQIQRQSAMLTEICKHLVPRVGSSVKACDLAYSKGLTNGSLYKIISLCPNLEYLDLTQTRISDLGFKGMQKSSCGKKLRHVDLTGCLYITDVTLQRLSAAMGQVPCHMTPEDQQVPSHMTPEDQQVLCHMTPEDQQVLRHMTPEDQQVPSHMTPEDQLMERRSVGVYDHVPSMTGTATNAANPDVTWKNNTMETEYGTRRNGQELPDNDSQFSHKQMCNAVKMCACRKSLKNSNPGIQVISCETTRKLSDCCGSGSQNKRYTCHDRTSSQVLHDEQCNANNTVDRLQKSTNVSNRITEPIVIQLDQLRENLEWKFHKSTSVLSVIEGQRSTRTCVDVSTGMTDETGSRTNCSPELDPSVNANEIKFANHDRESNNETLSSSPSNTGSRTKWNDPYLLYNFARSNNEQMTCWNQTAQISEVNMNKSIQSAEMSFRNSMDSTLTKIQNMIMNNDLEKVAAEIVDIPEDESYSEVGVTATDVPDRCLEFLSLSGCYQITDDGIRSLVDNGGLPRLCYLDLSGCLNLTGAGISDLVATCGRLEPGSLYYCDNIVDGPYPDTASGCRNLQCTTRVCCRTGE